MALFWIVINALSNPMSTTSNSKLSFATRSVHAGYNSADHEVFGYLSQEFAEHVIAALIAPLKSNVLAAVGTAAALVHAISNVCGTMMETVG